MQANAPKFRVPCRRPALWAALVLLAATSAQAQVLPWVTNAGVGSNEVDLTLDLTCSTGGLICNLLDSYVDMQTATLNGGGTVELDDPADTFQFLQDSTQDLADGMGPVPAYLTTNASDVDFAEISLVGVPMLRSSLLFALDDPVIGAPGLDLATPGDYPFSAMLTYSAISDVVGDLNVLLPEIIVPPDTIPVAGTFRVLAGGGSEIRDVTGSFSYQTVTTMLGENVTVDIAADLTLNLLVDPPPPPVVPALPVWALALLASGLLLAAASLRRRGVL